MFINLLFALCLLLGLESQAHVFVHKHAPVCKTQAECEDLDNPCRCYCAFKPGYREKIEKDPDNPQLIKTIKGEGYKFEI